MDEVSFKTEATIGSVSSICGKLNFTFVVHSSGNAHVQIYASDPSDARKSGVLITLGEDGYTKLKDIIVKIDNTI